MTSTASFLSTFALAAALVLGLAVPAQAQRSAQREAIAACSEHEDGDDCSVRLGGRTIAGTCMAPPDGELVCVLDRTGTPPAGGERTSETCDGWEEDGSDGL